MCYRIRGPKSTNCSVDGETPGFAHEDAIAFGDGNNDYELISSVGYGVAMGNAVAPVKEVAKFVTKRLQFGRNCLH